MSRKIKVLVGVLLGVIVLTLGRTAIAFADDTAAAGDNTTRLSILDRVAQILNIDRQTLIDAFNQAKQEMQADNQTKPRGLTEEQRERLQEKRQAQIDRMKEKMEQMRERAAEARLKMLDKAVEKGVITAEEKQQILDWWEARPEALDKLTPGAFAPGQAKPKQNAQRQQKPTITNTMMPRLGSMAFR
ncbi:MAG: DUF2680 domain-containing protein [Dehalococcoidales bacterium]|nr:DUF2680 domain-containing protein [Dehalococcoidales bacterium]